MLHFTPNRSYKVNDKCLLQLAAGQRPAAQSDSNQLTRLVSKGGFTESNVIVIVTVSNAADGHGAVPHKKCAAHGLKTRNISVSHGGSPFQCSTHCHSPILAVQLFSS